MRRRIRVCPTFENVRLDEPELPPKLYAHANELYDALRGHHERAIAFFGMLAEHHLGPDVSCHVERPGGTGPFRR